MTSRNKKILWSIIGATAVVLTGLYLFFPPVHNWVNSVIGRNEKEYPKPTKGVDDEFEYGKPVEEIEGETIEVPRDSLLDSLINADTTLAAGVVRPVNGPPPAHVEGFGEGPLPPAPSEDDLPNKDENKQELENQPVDDIVDVEQHTSDNSAVNKKIASCRTDFNKLVETYRQYKSEPTPKLKADGAKLKADVLKSLTQLMKLSQTHNDEAGMEEAADLRREVNKMEF